MDVGIKSLKVLLYSGKMTVITAVWPKDQKNMENVYFGKA